MSRFIRVPGHRLAKADRWHYAGTKRSAWTWTCQCGTAGVADIKHDARRAHAEHKAWVRWAHQSPSGAA
jgi:hypothetical protein